VAGEVTPVRTEKRPVHALRGTASCRRADGTPIGVGGGDARPGVRFWPDRRR